jgi:hypothetical protein
VLNRPPPADSGTWDDADIRVVRQGTWFRDFSCPQAYLRTLTRSSRAGDELRFDFRGTRIALLYARDAEGGVAEILVDGGLRGTVDQYAPAPQFSARWETEGLAPGPHTIVVRVAGRTVNVDGFAL